MRDFVNKSRIFCFLIAAVFLAAISSVVSLAAENPAPVSAASSASPVYEYPAGTTVESLQAQLDAQGKGQKLSVIKPDGNRRASGPLQAGDIVEVCDSAGNLQARVTAAFTSESSSAGRSSSVVPSSSQPASSQAAGGPASSSSSASEESPASSQSGKLSEYVFPSAVTVEELKTEIEDKLSAGCTIQITPASGGNRTSGRICTGDVIRVLNPDGSGQSAVRAVVLGDVARVGGPDSQSKTLLYRYLTGQEEFDSEQETAADLNQDGKIDTSDLLLLKKKLTASSKD